jgi:hypothetical protein
MGAVTRFLGNAGPIAAGILAFYDPFSAARLAGGIFIFAGVIGYCYPVPCKPSFACPNSKLTYTVAHSFGIPFASNSNTMFVPAIGGRNLAAGLTISTLAYLEDKRAIGILIAFWTLAGWADIGVLWAWRKQGSENIFVHARNIAVLMGIAWALLIEERV